MRLVFAGTPEFAVPALRAAMAHGEVTCVYTQPDRASGRGRKLTPSPVKQLALDAGIPVHQPVSLRSTEAQDTLRALQPDVMIVVAYGLILPQEVLDIPRVGCWNLHASLLPRWRGAAPIQRAIEAGDAQTGVCLMQMEQGLDTGPVLLSKTLTIGPEDTSGHLHQRLAALGAEILANGLTRLKNNTLPAPQPQSETGITYAHKLDKSEARLDWLQPAETLARKIRAFHPWPIAEADLAGERLRLHVVQALNTISNATPGTIVAASRAGIDIACGQGTLRLTRIQREGGKPITAADWCNARRDLSIQRRG